MPVVIQLTYLFFHLETVKYTGKCGLHILKNIHLHITRQTINKIKMQEEISKIFYLLMMICYLYLYLFLLTFVVIGIVVCFCLLLFYSTVLNCGVI